jgi:hypothetical protein
VSRTLQLVISDLEFREEMGRSKYGTTVDRNDLAHEAWLRHAYEEALDMAMYLRRALSEIEDAKPRDPRITKLIGEVAARMGAPKETIMGISEDVLDTIKREYDDE